MTAEQSNGSAAQSPEQDIRNVITGAVTGEKITLTDSIVGTAAAGEIIAHDSIIFTAAAGQISGDNNTILLDSWGRFVLGAVVGGLLGLLIGRRR